MDFFFGCLKQLTWGLMPYFYKNMNFGIFVITDFLSVSWKRLYILVRIKRIQLTYIHIIMDDYNKLIRLMILNSLVTLMHRQKLLGSWAWWCTSVISALGRLRQKDCREFEAILGYKVSFMLAWTTEQDSISKNKKLNKNKIKKLFGMFLKSTVGSL